MAKGRSDGHVEELTEHEQARIPFDIAWKADRVGSKIDERLPLGFNTSSSLPAESSTPRHNM